MAPWLLLSYKVPREPTSARVYVWRKLRRLGALPIQDAVWVLPLSPVTHEQFEWLASEIDELGGEASVWESRAALDGQDEALTERFRTAVEEHYRQILSDLKRKNADLGALARQYRQVLSRDYFKSELGGRVRAALAAARQEVQT